jgi:hypothetical protein
VHLAIIGAVDPSQVPRVSAGLVAVDGDRVRPIYAPRPSEKKSELQHAWDREDALDVILEEYLDPTVSVCELDPERIARASQFLFGYLFALEPRTVLLSGHSLAFPPFWLEADKLDNLRSFVSSPVVERYSFFEPSECLLRFRTWGLELGGVKEWMVKIPSGFGEPKHLYLSASPEGGRVRRPEGENGIASR